MNLDHLVRMANQISQFFESQPDPDEARQGLANHLRKFWEPRMRQTLLDAAATDNTLPLRPLLREAIAQHGAWLREGVVSGG